MLTLLLIASALAGGHDVGVLVWSDTIPGQVAMRQGVQAEAKRLNAAGADLRLHVRVAGDGAQGIERQIQQMNEMIDQGVNAIIVQPTDSAALTAPLQRANQQRIPVVAYDQYIKGGKLASYITSDNRQAGRLDGEFIAARFDDEHIVQLVLVEYPHVSSTIERVDGFIDALTSAGQPFRIVGRYQGVDPVSGAKAASQILQKHPTPGSIDVVFTVNDGGGLAVVHALAQAGRTEIAVASIDGDPASVKNIAQSRLTVIDAAQFCGHLGTLAMRTTHEVLEGNTPAPYVLIPTFPITKETLPRYGGWTAPLPGPFQLPWTSSMPIWSPEPRTSSVAP